jgi:hypothetical protein
VTDTFQVYIAADQYFSQLMYYQDSGLFLGTDDYEPG